MANIPCGNDARIILTRAKVDQAGGIAKSQTVSIKSAGGEVLTVEKGDVAASGHIRGHILGLAYTAANDGAEILIILKGELRGVNTSTFAEGERLHASTNGTLTGATPPVEGAHVYMGNATKIHASAGTIYVNPAPFIHAMKATAGLDLEFGLGSSDDSSKMTFTKFDGTEIFKILASGLYVDAITELTADAGVTIESVLIKDSEIHDNFIGIQTIGSPTYTTLQHLNNLLNSSGLLSNGTIITDAGGGEVDLSASKCLIRISDSDTAALKSADISAAAGQTITANSIRYIGIEYNAGTPQYVIKTSDVWNDNDEFFIGSVVNESGTLHIANNPAKVGNAIIELLHRIYETEPIKRADRVGGLILGETGTRNITVSAGELYDNLNEFTISALDTSVTGSFASYYDTTQQAAAATQWDNDNYNNSGVLTSLTTNRYANLWFYVELDSNVVMVYGTGQYTSPALAQAEGVPATVPNRLQAHGKLIGRIIFQKGGAAAAIPIESAFSEVFVGAGAADHGGLTGLADDDHTQYSLITSQSGTPSSTPGRVGEINVDTTNDRVFQSVGTSGAGDWVLVNNRFVVWRLLDKDTAHAADTNIAGDLRLPLAYKIKNIWVYADTAGTGSVTTFDVNEAGTTVLSTKITIDATEDHSKDAATPPVISDSAIPAWAEVTVDIDGIASGDAGIGATLVMEIDFTG